VVDLSEVPMIGVSSSMAIEKLVLEDLERGRAVFIVGAKGTVRERFDRMGLTAAVSADHMLDTRQEALAMAEHSVGNGSAPGGPGRAGSKPQPAARG